MRTPILTLVCLSLLAPCTASAACGPNIPGNLNADCRVNFNDFAILAADWSIHPNDCPPNYPPGDLNLDCSVNSLDLDQMAVHWLQACTAKIPADLSGDCKVNFKDLAPMASDWLTPSIAHEWVATYDGPANSKDRAKAIAVDSNNNIYVTGRSTAPDTKEDYLTIKYSPDSNQPVWVARYNVPGNGDDHATAVAVDSKDNIYVTGSNYGSYMYCDYITVKYSQDSNQPVWLARYNGPANGHDHATNITTDSNDNIYVTGNSDGSGTGRGYTTIKYSPDSNQPVWVARYNGPANGHDYATNIATDSNDNIYVTGASYGAGTEEDFATIKYSQDSNHPLWVARYNGPANDSDIVTAIAIDSNDNIYVTGASYGAGTGEDFATIKYSPDSNQPVWVARYNGPGNSRDVVTDMALDSRNNIYITGPSLGSTTHDDYATIKYSPDSNQPVWMARYNGINNRNDRSWSIAVDSNDNIYVSGGSSGVGCTTIRYSPDSNQPVSVISYTYLRNSPDSAQAIAVDSNDNIYITSYSYRSDTNRDYLIIKYPPDFACTPQVTGDFDHDCDVDIYDLEVFCQSWLDCNLDPPHDCWQ
jgi:uncharacterized delta-60 repeat protein